MELIFVGEPLPQVWLRGPLTNQAVSLAEVDWSSEVAVVVDLGEQPTGGYSLTPLSVQVVQPGLVELHLTVERPSPGGFFTQAVTRPHAVIRLPREPLGQGRFTLVAYDQGQTELARKVVSL